jgi:hypothetical protein
VLEIVEKISLDSFLQQLFLGLKSFDRQELVLFSAQQLVEESNVVLLSLARHICFSKEKSTPDTSIKSDNKLMVTLCKIF